MISGHYRASARQTDNGLMRQQYLLHEFLLRSISATAIAQIMLGAGAYTLCQVSLLQATHKCGTHHGTQISVLAV